jgi:hypothetical protein
MLKDFINICKATQPQLKKYVQTQLRTTHPNVISEDGFVFAEGKFPVLLVAHLDTVHAKTPHKIKYMDNNDVISSPQGIGGDDRCGVYMIFEVLKKFNCSVLFCEDEEIGMIGAEKFINSKIAEKYIAAFNYIIEFDRRDKNDAVFYDCDNKDFEAFITQEFYCKNFGSFSDISTIAPYLQCAAVNLSCGYHHAHSAQEFVVISEMHNSINATCKILERTTPADVFEYVEAPRNKWDGFFTSDCAYEDDMYYISYYSQAGTLAVYETYAFSEAEALGNFMMDNPNYCFNDVVDFGCEPAIY